MITTPPHGDRVRPGAGGEARVALHGRVLGAPPLQGSRPPCLGVPHARVQRRTVQQVVDAVPLVPLLDDPVPQMVDTVLEFFRALDLPVVEQVIAVPKISTDRVSQRLVERRLPQMVEQLVDVPTVLTPTRIALQVAEQLVRNNCRDDAKLVNDGLITSRLRCWTNWRFKRCVSAPQFFWNPDR